jgi:hypothetical protein
MIASLRKKNEQLGKPREIVIWSKMKDELKEIRTRGI